MKRRFSLKATVFDIKGNVIATGVNSYTKTHPKQAHYAEKCGDPKKVFLHAEIAALVKCRKQPYKIKIERYSKEGSPMNAQPCPICMMAIKEAGVKLIEYTL